MFEMERIEAREKLSRRQIDFRVAGTRYRVVYPNKLIDRNILRLIGVDRGYWSEEEFARWVDSDEFLKHFSGYDVTYADPLAYELASADLSEVCYG